ncbi:hypothetical protein JCM33374_g3088 [Metschnikowia sp. JCM 33374]|nr:hypothetical protein JCM33374_g3088 [Metschnikowia sp. JCM 33374]
MGLDVMRHKRKKALCSLDKYAAQLGSFLTEAKFDSRRFSSLARSLEIGLLDITRAVAEVAHWCRQVYDRLIFVNYVFRAMDDCSKGSVHFHSTTGEATHWAYCVVQPYVQLLGIHGLNGYDDGQNSVYANAVGLQIKYLTFWKDMLKYMADAPLNVRLWVDRQLYEAEKMIEHLTCDKSDRRYGSIKCSPI